MNRNYKVIWNQSLNCFMAVAEYAKSRGKSSSGVVSSDSATHGATGNTHLLRLSALCIGLASAGFSMQASAIAACAEDNAAGAGVVDRVQCGTGANAAGSTSVAIGQNAQATGGQTIAIGGVGGGQATTASGDQSTAIGANAVSSGSSSIAIGGDDLNKASGTTENADGTVTVGAVNSGEVNTIFKKYSGGRDLVDTSQGGNQYPYTESSGAASVAVGVQAVSSGALSTAFGTQANATGVASSAFGVSAEASKEGSVAIGAGSKTDGSATKVESQTVNGITFTGFDGASGFAGNAGDAGRQVSVGLIGNERQIKNVAPGEISASSTDAINGSQVFSVTNELVDNIRGAQATADAVADGTAGIVRQDTGTGAITVGATTGGTSVDFTGTGGVRTLSGLANGNVAAGSTEAVTGDQLNTTNANVTTAQTTANTANTTANMANTTANSALTQANLGFDITADNGTQDNIQLGETVDFTNTDGNLVSTVSDNGINYDLADNISVTQATIDDGTNSTVLTSTATGLDIGGDKITNVADGTIAAGSTEVVTGNQLNATNADVTANTGNINTNTSDIDDINAGRTGIVRQDASTGAITVGAATGGTSVGFSNSAGDDRQLTGVAAGTADNDAVNVGQLNTTNSNVTDNSNRSTGNLAALGGGAAYDAANNIYTAPSYLLDDGTNTGTNAPAFSNVGDALGNLDTRTITNTANINKGISFGNGTTDNNFALGDTINVTGDSNITSTTTTGGVQVSLNESVDLGVNGSVRTGNTTVNRSGITLTGGTNQTVTLSNEGLNNGGNRITKVADGIVADDAVNFGQLDAAAGAADIKTDALGNSTASNLGGGASYNAATGVVEAPTYTLNNGDNDGNTTGYNDVGSALGNLDGRTTANTSGLADLASGRTGLVRQDAGTGAITVGAATGGTSVGFSNSAGDDRQLTGVAAGTADNDAVNVGQLNTTNSNVATNASNITDNNNRSASNLATLGGGAAYDAANDIYTAPTYTLNNGNNDATTTDYNDVGSALGNLDSRTTTNTTDIAKGFNISAAGGTNDNVQLGESVNFTNTDGNLVVTNTVDNGINYNLADNISVTQATIGDATNNTVLTSTANGLDVGGDKITNLSNGTVATGSSDAVTGDQLNTTNDNVAANRTDIDTNTSDIDDINAGRTGIVRQDAGTGAITVGAATGGTSVNFTGTNGVRTLSGLANGNVAAGSTEAVTGDQLNTTNTNVTANRTDIDINAGNITDNSNRSTGNLAALGGGAAYNAATDTYTVPTYTLDDGTNTTTNTTVNNVGGALSNLDTRTTTNTTDINKGISFGNGTTDNNFTLGDTINVTGDSNLTSTTTADGVQVSLNESIDLGANGSFTAGNSVLNNTGLTITGGPSVTSAGINAAGNKITNVDDGTDAGDAVNFGQLEASSNAADTKTDALGNSTASNLGGGANYNAATGAVSAPSYTLDDGTNTGTNAPAFNNVGDALGNLDNRTTTNTSDIDDINAGRTGIVRQDAGTGAITVGAQTGGTSVDFSNSTGDDRTLTGVSAGTADNDAVNVGQLNTTNSNVTDNSNRSTGNLAALGGGAAYDAANNIYTAPSYLLDDGTNTGTNAPAFSNVGDALGNLDTRTTTNTADINKGISFGNGTTDNNFALGDTINVIGDSNITSTTTTGGVQVSLNDNIDVNRITAGNSTLNNAGVTIVDGPNNTVTLSGSGLSNGNNRITNLADGIAPNDAATFGQLTDTNNIATGNLSALGGDAAYDAATDTYTVPTYTLDDGSNTGTTSDFNNVGSALGNLDGRTTANTSGLADLASGRTGLVRQDAGTGAITVGAQTGGTNVDFTNVDGTERQLTGVASAGDITDVNNANNAVNAGDVNTAVTGLTDAGLNFQDDNGTVIDRNLGQTLSITGGETDSNNLTAGNIGVVANGTDGLSVQLAKDIDLGTDGSVTTGNTLMNNAGLSVNDNAGNATTITTAGTSVVDADGNEADYTAASTSLSNDAGNTNVSTATGNTITTGNNVTTTTGTGTTVTDGTNTSNYGADGFTATDGINSTTVGTDRISISGTDNTDPANPVSNTLVLDGNTGQISGVADATAADQAINKGQLDAIASAGNTKADALGASTASNLGGGATYNATTGTVSAPSYTLDNGANAGVNTTVNNVGAALTNLDGRTTANTSGLADLASGRTGLVRQDAGTGTITVGAQTGGTSVDFTNVDGVNRQLTGVAAGTADNDAVNKAQLDAITGNISASGVQYDRNNDNTVNYDRVSFNGTQAVIGKDDSDNDIVISGGTTLTNVADGINASDAVNKGQLDSATKVKVFDSSGDEVTINVAEQVANTSVDNDNLDSLFLTYDKTGQEVTDRLTIGQTVQKMNTEGVKFAHTNARDNGAGGVGITNDSSAGGFDSTAIGVNAIIKEGADSTIALGHDTEATETAKDSVVIGKGSKVSGASSVAIGDSSEANGTQSISIGTGNIVNGNNSGAFGDPSIINGNNSYSVGNDNTIDSDDTFVFGNNVTQTVEGSVVLGTGSAAITGAGIVGFGAASNAAIAATTSTTGAVSVGDAANGVYRQVTGVAAGTADSDAVNVSQLKAVSDALGDSNTSLSNAAVQYDKNPNDTVNKGSITLGGGAEGTTITNVANGVQATDAVNKGQLDNLGSGIAGIIGGDASYDADGNLTANNIGGTGQGNISDAIAAINQGNAQANEDIQANNEQITNNTGRLDAGISFGADNGDNISQSVGGNSGSIQFQGGNNITTNTANGGIQIGLDGNIEVDSVTTGNTVVNDNGVTIQNGPSMTAEGFNAANTVITGVEAGVNEKDAVNFGQLTALDKKLGDSVNALGYRIGEVEDDANAGISAAMAMSSLPQAYIPGKSMVGGGIASYNGESAVAVGVSKVSDNGRWVIKVNGTADTQGNAGGAVGAGFHF